MADWPDVSQLKQRLNVTTADWDDQLERLLAGVVAQVQFDVGEEVDEPTDSLAQAALELAVSVGSTEGEPNAESFAVAARSPKYLRLLKGHRVRFGVA